MSDRGHWTTQLVWCKDCAVVLYEYFVRPYNVGKWRAQALGAMPWSPGAKYWCIAGLVQGLYAGEEIHIFENIVTEELQEQLCHTVTFWVFAEAYDAPVSITVSPKHTGMAVDG